MFKKLVAVVAVAAVIAPVAAQAADHGFYVGADAGAVWQDLGGRLEGLPISPSALSHDQSPDVGWAAFGEIGTSLGSEFRIEGELGYRASTYSDVSHIDHLTVMANLLYELPVGDDFSLSFGGGAGLDKIRWSGDGVSPVAGFSLSVDKDDWRFAAQGIVAANLKLSDKLTANLKYRYLFAPGGSSSSFSDDFLAADVSAQTVSLGLTLDLD